MTLSVDSLPALLSPKQFAEITGMDRRTVLNMCAKGRLPAKQIPGSKMWRISSAVVKDWLKFFGTVSALSNAEPGAENGK
jgi:excisionase family DNA binding protein